MHFSMLHGRAPIVDLLLQKVRRARPTAHSIDSSDDSLSTVIQKTEACASVLCSGGDDGDRTHDLRLAKPALSQLSYVPVITAPAATRLTLGRLLSRMVGLTRLELVTSRLSAGRSDQLSYRPIRK